MPLTMKNATIAAGESLSSAVDVSGNVGIKRVIMPAAWTEAWLMLKASNDGVTYYDVFLPDGSPFVVNVVPNTMVLVFNDVFNLGYFKFQSGRPGNPMPQAEERIFICGVE